MYLIIYLVFKNVIHLMIVPLMNEFMNEPLGLVQGISYTISQNLY